MKHSILLATLLIALSALIGSCQHKPKTIQEKIAQAVKEHYDYDKDIVANVVDVGQTYGCAWPDDDRTKKILIDTLGETDYKVQKIFAGFFTQLGRDTLLEGMPDGDMGLVNDVGDQDSNPFLGPEMLKRYAMGIDRLLKSCNIKPTACYAMCRISIRHKIYDKVKTFVSGVVYSEEKGENGEIKPSVYIIPDKSTLKAVDL